ncbi:O-methyltransferase [Oceanobacillus manasiensis]|uniref:O-methyltransferase n=1 Tax=Oceanobacillus manasiensis TaxID=586413 RepID=UPI000ADB473A|nr:O-methyltransferase [Oceanobacillus manasiensis]
MYLKEEMNNYLIDLLPDKEAWIEEMEAEALTDRVPIMDKVSMHFVTQLIRMYQPKRILEVGTAIGYSALRMLQANPETSIITIERDEKRYKQAVENIHQQGKEDNISVILGDALEEIAKLDGMFDLVFIDAAKGQYKRFFELSKPLLSSSGVILSDNVLFKGYVAEPEKATGRHIKMVEKIRDYNKWLMQHPNFSTSIVPIGDGVAISVRKP